VRKSRREVDGDEFKVMYTRKCEKSADPGGDHAGEHPGRFKRGEKRQNWGQGEREERENINQEEKPTSFEQCGRDTIEP